MKKIILTLAVVCLSLFGQTFAYREILIQNIDKHPVRVIKVILDGQDFVVTSVASNGGDSLSNLVNKVGGTAGVNGVFFCPDDYSYCGKETHSISERVFMGNGADYSTFWPDTSIRMIFGFDKTGSPMLVQNNLGSLQDAGLWTNTTDKIGDVYFGLGNFPVFLLEGEDVMYGYTTYLDAKMKAKANKTFICSTQDKKTVYMGVVGTINLVQMPAYLKKNFGCYNAINLDAGSSIGMVYSGFVLDQGPRKRIMDAFVVLTRDQYIGLTDTTPAIQSPYIPDEGYQMNDLDHQKVNTLYTVLQGFIKQNGAKQRSSFITFLRSALDNPVVQQNSSTLAIIKELLFKLYIIGSI
ncbi:MAG: phosphodiester glycosidase family protein [Candidatus Absconditabacteria bacterium]